MEIVERTDELVVLTPSAAAKIKGLMAEEPQGEASVLRVAVQGGGCSGFEYALGFDGSAQEGDLELESLGVTVVVRGGGGAIGLPVTLPAPGAGAPNSSVKYRMPLGLA